jgi:hypothetical protein
VFCFSLTELKLTLPGAVNSPAKPTWRRSEDQPRSDRTATPMRPPYKSNIADPRPLHWADVWIQRGDTAASIVDDPQVRRHGHPAIFQHGLSSTWYESPRDHVSTVAVPPRRDVVVPPTLSRLDRDKTSLYRRSQRPNRVAQRSGRHDAQRRRIRARFRSRRVQRRRESTKRP